jgi:hypothetical protein
VNKNTDRFEYRVVDLRDERVKIRPEIIEHCMNELGSEGWQFIQHVQGFGLFFMRKVVD